MTSAVVEKRFYNSDKAETADLYALMSLTLDLPSSVCVGMKFRVGSSYAEIESVCWNADEQKFYCVAKPEFLDILSIDSPDFDERIEWLKDDGWKFGGRFDSDTYVADSMSDHKDDEDDLRKEINQLSDFAKIELRRRLDNADALGKMIVSEKRALAVDRELFKSKIADAKRNYKWGFGLLVLLAVVDFLFPSWIKDEGTYLFLLLGMTILSFLYNEVVCQNISKNIQRHSDTYDNLCYQWAITTGVRWSNKCLAVECAKHNHSYPLELAEDLASPSEIDEHWLVVARSVLRIVRNRYGMARYDMW